MSKYWSSLIHQLDPYVPGEQPQDKKYIKLNTNENPYPPSPKVLEAIKAHANGDVRLYPDPNATRLVEQLAKYYDVAPEEVFVGNGSDEVLAFSFQAFFTNGRPILFPNITYSFYPVYCNLYGITYKHVPLQEDMSLSVASFQQENGGIIFPNPNAPTGREIALAELTEIVASNQDSVVIIDEAYVDFGGESAISLTKEFPNLLVIQTFSKSRSLAGLRVGFAIGQKDLIEALNRVKNSFNSYPIDRIALAAAIESMRDEDYFQTMRQRVIETRKYTAEQLQSLGFHVIPSAANFLFITHPAHRADKMYEYLKENGILVRYFNKPNIDNYLRVSIGTDEEMAAFLEQLARYIKNKG